MWWAPNEDRTRDLSLTKRMQYHYAMEAVVAMGQLNWSHISLNPIQNMVTYYCKASMYDLCSFPMGVGAAAAGEPPKGPAGTKVV